MHFMELHKNEEILVKPGVEDLAPYPLYRAAPPKKEGAIPTSDADSCRFHADSCQFHAD